MGYTGSLCGDEIRSKRKKEESKKEQKKKEGNERKKGREHTLGQGYMVQSYMSHSHPILNPNSDTHSPAHTTVPQTCTGIFRKNG